MTERRLLGPADLAEQGPAEAVRLPIDLVDPSPHNPRRALTEIDLLAESIREFGLLQPVTVRRLGERYELLGGHRRRAAFALLADAEPWEVRWKSIPAVVRTMDDDETAYLALLSGQLHSKNWNPREEASALERLAETRTLRQVGSLVHKSEGWVSKRLKIYSDAILSAFVQTKRLTPDTAAELLSVIDTAQRRELAERAAGEQWTQQHARAEVRKLRLDKMAREAGKLTRQLLEILTATDPSKLPIEVTRDLWTLSGRIQVMGRGGPIMPTIAEAEKRAGVKSQTKPSRTRKAKPKRRTMPRPA